MIPKLAPEEKLKYNASKWLVLPMLLGNDEMQLFATEHLSFPFVALGGVQQENDVMIGKEEFLERYAEYLREILKDKSKARPSRRLTFGMTTDLNDLRLQRVEGGVIVKIASPIIQVEPYTLHFSEEEKKFREMTPSKNRFFWGLRFAFPQLYDNPISDEVEKITEEGYPNAALFKKLQKWARDQTRPSEFTIGGKTYCVPARIGKKLFEVLRHERRL
jgi:hypothetical protein